MFSIIILTVIATAVAVSLPLIEFYERELHRVSEQSASHIEHVVREDDATKDDW